MMLTTIAKLWEAAFDTAPEARVVIDTNGTLALANQRARSLFSLSKRHIGTPFRDLELSYRPAELRSSIEKVYSDRSAVSLGEIEWREAYRNNLFLDIQLTPLIDVNNEKALVGVNISFNDVTHFKQLQHQLEHSNQELETAMEELQSTNEELETTNEELQSTNEELETMNEELQSNNQEMQTINEDLRQRNLAFDQVNAFMDSILSSLKSGVIVLDRELRILVWNRKSEDLWGLREEEILGQNLYSLDIGLPLETLRKTIRACLVDGTGHQEVVVVARNRRGRNSNYKVTCSPLKDDSREARGIIVISEEMDSSSEAIVD